jgi:predicted component of type VI protein secretion system
METFLQEWLYRFILPNSENANIELEAQKPLAGAEIRLTEVENGWIGKLRLSPHFQLEAPGVTLVTQFGLCWRHV